MILAEPKCPVAEAKPCSLRPEHHAAERAGHAAPEPRFQIGAASGASSAWRVRAFRTAFALPSLLK